MKSSEGSPEEEEVKEVEWVLISGGAFVGVPHKFKIVSRKYKGEYLEKHILKLPGKNLTWEVLVNEVKAKVGLPVEERFTLNYTLHIGSSPPTQDKTSYDMWLARHFSHFIGYVGTPQLPEPVTLYLRRGIY